MSTFTVISTVSHAYYAKRSKSEIIRRIDELRRACGMAAMTDEERACARAKTNHDLAFIALRLHQQLPEGPHV